MAWSEFYIQSGGSNMNSGTSNSATATVTQTNGNWSTATNIFAAASGTPFSGVVAGDWASIYVDGTTSGAVYIARVSTVNSGGASITLETTNKLGTAPATAATGISCKVGGAWADYEPMINSTLTATIATTMSIRLNVKAGTYTSAVNTGGVSLKFAPGAGTYRFWMRGYTTTPGDLDNDKTTVLVPGTNIPKLTLTGNIAFLNLTSNGWWSYFAVTNNSNAATVQGSFDTAVCYRCYFECLSTSNAACYSLASTGNVFVRCHFKATTTANGAVGLTGTRYLFYECKFYGGVANIYATTNSFAGVIVGCLLTDMLTYGINLTGTVPIPKIIGNTIVGASKTAGIRISNTLTTGNTVIAKNVISGFTYAVTVPATNQQVFLYMNTIYNCTNTYTNVGDCPTFLCTTSATTPYTSATDYTPHTSAVGGNNLQILEGLTIKTSVPVGAVNRNRLVGYMGV